MELKFDIIHSPLKCGGHIAECNFRSIVFKDGYHIFEEYAQRGLWGIYKRTSIDGVNLSERSNELIPLGCPGSFNQYGNADPTVIYDGVWKMWFDARNRDGIWEKIGYATSDDGDNWKVCGSVLARGDKYDNIAVHHPVCMKVSDRYYMYYSGSELQGYSVGTICLAVSDDGIKWDKYPCNPIIGRGSSGDWDRTYVRPSLPVLIEDKYYMFYWGFNGLIHSMGLAISDDLINWQKKGLILKGKGLFESVTASQPIGNKIYFTTWSNKLTHIMKYERSN